MVLWLIRWFVPRLQVEAHFAVGLQTLRLPLRLPPSPNERTFQWCCDVPVDVPRCHVLVGAILGEILPVYHVSPRRMVPLLNLDHYLPHLLEVHDSPSLCSRSFFSRFRQEQWGLQLL